MDNNVLSPSLENGIGLSPILESDLKVSFRGNPIPEVIPKAKYELSNSRSVIDSIINMTPEERRSVTLLGIHYGDYGIQDVKLSTGDIVPIETAIALAENHMLSGYTTGATFKGGKVLRSVPDQKNNTIKRLHDLPQF